MNSKAALLIAFAILLLLGKTVGAGEPKATGKLAADFVMKRTLKVLSDTITSSGKLALGGPGLLRWETTSPSKSVLIVNQSRAWIHYPELTIVKSFDIENDPIMKVLSEHLLALTSNDLGKLGALYKIEELPGSVKRLIPKQAEVKKILVEIRVKLGSHGIASLVEMVSANGDTTAITFKNVRLDPSLPPKLFKAPKEVLPHPVSHEQSAL